jgi:hypothetical protein
MLARAQGKRMQKKSSCASGIGREGKQVYAGPGGLRPDCDGGGARVTVGARGPLHRAARPPVTQRVAPRGGWTIWSE